MFKLIISLITLLAVPTLGQMYGSGSSPYQTLYSSLPSYFRSSGYGYGGGYYPSSSAMYSSPSSIRPLTTYASSGASSPTSGAISQYSPGTAYLSSPSMSQLTASSYPSSSYLSSSYGSSSFPTSYRGYGSMYSSPLYSGYSSSPFSALSRY